MPRGREEVDVSKILSFKIPSFKVKSDFEDECDKDEIVEEEDDDNDDGNDDDNDDDNINGGQGSGGDRGDQSDAPGKARPLSKVDS